MEIDSRPVRTYSFSSGVERATLAEVKKNMIAGGRLRCPGPDPLPWKPPLLRATQPPSSVPSCAVDFLAATTSGTRPSRFTKRTVSRLLLLVARRTRHYVVRASVLCVYVCVCLCVCEEHNFEEDYVRFTSQI